MDMRPTRVVVDRDGFGVTPARAAREYRITPEVIFVRNDGWSLGAPKELENVARELWRGKWIERWQRRDDDTWERTWPLPGDRGNH